jgi:hypothetical protein
MHPASDRAATSAHPEGLDMTKRLLMAGGVRAADRLRLDRAAYPRTVINTSMLRLYIAAPVLVPLGACGSSVAAAPTASAASTAQPTPTPTPDITAVSHTYLTAYSLLATTDGPLVAQQNAAAAGTSALTAALNGEIAAHQAFDSSVSAIDVSAFSGVTQDVRAIIAARCGGRGCVGQPGS